MVDHQLNRHETEQTLGDGEGQGNLACCSLWDHRVRHNLETEQQQGKETNDRVTNHGGPLYSTQFLEYACGVNSQTL